MLRVALRTFYDHKDITCPYHCRVNIVYLDDDAVSELGDMAPVEAAESLGYIFKDKHSKAGADALARANSIVHMLIQQLGEI